MEPSQKHEDDEYYGYHYSEQHWSILDDTLILMGLLVLQASLFKSGYSAEVITEIQDRLNRLIQYYGKKGV